MLVGNITTRLAVLSAIFLKACGIPAGILTIYGVESGMCLFSLTSFESENVSFFGSGTGRPVLSYDVLLVQAARQVKPRAMIKRLLFSLVMIIV